jgi:hypothetical protein
VTVARKKKKLRILKVEKIAPDKHVVELEVEGAPDAPSIPPPPDPLETDHPDLPVEKKTWLEWLKGLLKK